MNETKKYKTYTNLLQRLYNLKKQDHNKEMSDNFYYTSGRKADMNKEIKRIENKLNKLETELRIA